MPDILTESRDNPEFARVLEISALARGDAFDFELRASPGESEALARLLGLQSLRKLRFAGQLSPLPDGGWTLEAQLGATAVQTCVVTLEPVTTRIDQPVRRRYVASGRQQGRELIVAPDGDDEIEPLADWIDLGLVAVEALALALPAYPRKPDVALADRVYAPAGAEPIEDETVRPFAALAALRGKLGEGA